MILDYWARLTAATAFDLTAVNPGRGRGVMLAVVGATAGADMAITHKAASGDADSNTLMTVEVVANKMQFFKLPSGALRYIRIATFPTSASVYVVTDEVTNL